jgi:hypothetical protein
MIRPRRIACTILIELSMAKRKLVIEHVHGELAASVLIFSKFVLLVGLQMLVIVVYCKDALTSFWKRVVCIF